MHTYTSADFSLSWANAMPDRDSSYLSGSGGSGSLVEEGGPGSGLAGSLADGQGGSGTDVGGNVYGSGGMGGAGVPGNSDGFGNSSGGEQSMGLELDGICRDFIRNVCNRGKRCRFRHPDFVVPDMGKQKNEFRFCHDFQNKGCMRATCRFVHCSRDDEDYYKKTGVLPPKLREKVAARLGLSPMDLPLSRGEVPICRDFLKGGCLRGNDCRFRHVQKDDEYESSSLSPKDLALSRRELPICKHFLKGKCLRSCDCKFRHVQKDYENESRVGVGGVVGQGASGMVNAGVGIGGGVGAYGGMQGLVGGGGNMMGTGCTTLGGYRDAGLSGVGGMGGGGMSGCLSIGLSGQRRYDRTTYSMYNPLPERGTALQQKRQRLERVRLTDESGAGHYESGVQATLAPRPLEASIYHTALQQKRPRLERVRLTDESGAGHHESGVQATLAPRPLEASIYHTALQQKRPRLERVRLTDWSRVGHYESGVQATLATRPLEASIDHTALQLKRPRLERVRLT